MGYGAERKADIGRTRTHNVLLQLVLCQDQDLGVSPEALDGGKVACALLLELGTRHDFEDIEARPGHVVAKHFEVCELHERRCLEVHVVGANLFAAFFYALRDVFFLTALVVAEASDEVVERLFEPWVESASEYNAPQMYQSPTCWRLLKDPLELCVQV